jgi:predicted DNA-binding transcriptional regulator AlpA
LETGLAGTSGARPKRSPKRETAWPRGLRREAAADYVGVSPSHFDEWVKQGIMPKPKKIGGVVLWDRGALDDALDALFYSEADAEAAAWDDVRA